ncbi:(2Fe-2S)-binding protein [Kitasatospora sp. NPDC008050]|uniref:(2Fe-2S)-binding protein n=1 Tax=Kitasatospora sp. NPDC008050 TaxID=3364021 RepID=UPI0036ECD2A9
MPERIAALGPFFAFETHAPGPVEGPWRSMGELLDEPSVLRDRVAAVRGYLAAGGGQPAEAVELRVAASVTQLGLASRLLSPGFAVAALTGAVLSYGLRDARWQPTPGSLFPLSLPDRTAAPVADPAERAARLGRELFDGPIRELAAATGGFALSPRILWGNVASAVNGAASAIARTEPELAGEAREFADRLLEQPPLRGAGGRTDDGSGFRRRSCCLIYRAAPDRAGALCGDCVLTSPPRTRARSAPS